MFKLIVKEFPNVERFWLGFRISEYSSNRDISAFLKVQAKPPVSPNIVLKLVPKDNSFPFKRRPLDQYIWSTCSNFIIFFFFFFSTAWLYKEPAYGSKKTRRTYIPPFSG